MKKTIITVVGHDTVGIIAKVCTYLANNKINILDISLMMIVDASQSAKSTSELVTELDQIGEEIGVMIRCQHEDIFHKMHRI